MKPMKLTDVGQKEAPRYIADDNWVMQQKLDGARVMAVVENGSVLFTNDGENEIKFAAARLALPALTAEMAVLMERLDWKRAIFDGELIVETGEYWIFDVLIASHFVDEVNSEVDVDSPLDWRLEILEKVGRNGTRHIHTTPTARTTEHKQALWDRVLEAGVEGAVSKRIDSIYQPGIRTVAWVKHKLVKSADCIVIATNRTFKDNGVVHTGSAALAVNIRPEQDPAPWMVVTKGGKRKRYAGTFVEGPIGTPVGAVARWEPRERLTVGAASLIGKDLAIEPGSVVEVAFLYFTGGAMVQPRIMRLRTDKKPEECEIDQFIPYTREIAWTGA